MSANSSYASLAGTWTGNGKASISGGVTYNCSVIKAIFSETIGAFEIKEAYQQCGQASGLFNQTIFEYQNGKLLINGNEVGTYNGQEVSIHDSNVEENREMSYSWSLLNGKLNYLEIWSKDGAEELRFEGVLSIGK